MAQWKFTAVVHQEGRFYFAGCPEVGTVNQGETVEEAVANLIEVTELFLEAVLLNDDTTE